MKTELCAKCEVNMLTRGHVLPREAQRHVVGDVSTFEGFAQDFDGDAHAPVLGAEWQEATREDHVSAQGLPFSFVRYTRQR